MSPNSSISAQKLGNEKDLNVIVAVIDSKNKKIAAKLDTNKPKAWAFSLESLAAGDYQLVAGTDFNNNGFICETNELCGNFGKLISLTGKNVQPGVEIEISMMPDDSKKVGIQ
jgi:hypothetical protein